MKYFLLIVIVSFFNCSQKEVQQMPLYNQQATDTVKSILSQAASAQNINYDSSLALYTKAIKLSKNLNDDRGLLDAYRMAIFTSGVLQNNDSIALNISDESLQFARKYNDANTLCDMYGMRALVYQATGNLDSATAVNEIALKYMEADNAPDSLKNWPLYNNVSSLYRDLDNYKLAIEYTNRYKTYLETIKDTARFINVHNNLYVYYAAMNDTTNAAEHIYKAYKLMNDLKDEDANVFSNLTLYYNSKGKYDSAIYFSEKRLALAKKNADTLSAIRAYIGMLEVTKRSGNVTAAQKLLPEAAMLFTGYRGDISTYDEKDLYDVFYSNYMLTGNNMPAYMYLELSKNLAEEIRKQEINKDLEKYELARKKVMQENVLLAKELQLNKKNNTILLLLIAGVLLGGSGLWLMIAYKRKNKLQQKQIEFLEKEKAWNHTKSLLEGQLEERNRISRELHDDLGASLTSIALASGIIKNKKENAIEKELHIIETSAAEMVGTMNEIVWSLNSHNDSLLGTVAYIRKFAAGFLSKTNITLDMQEDLPQQDLPVSSKVRRAVYLSAKEAIHNVVKHSGATKVLIKANYANNVFSLLIHDNGKGFAAAGNKTGGGNGMGNMKKNMALVNGTFAIHEDNGMVMEITCTL